MDNEIEYLIKKLINDAPEELRPWLTDAAYFLQDKTADEIKAWINLLVDYEWEEAYKAMLEAMTYEQRAQEQAKIAESLRVLNSANADDILKQRELIKALLSLAISLLVKQLTASGQK